MRKNAKEFVTINCGRCGKPFDKEKKEYARQTKRGRTKFYCNRICASSNCQLDEFSPFRRVVTNARSNAKPHKMLITITVEDVKKQWDKQNGLCAYTNIPMRIFETAIRKEWIPTTMSLDRIDSSKGYTPDNIELVCLSINLAKNGFTKDQMKDFIRQIRD